MGMGNSDARPAYEFVDMNTAGPGAVVTAFAKQVIAPRRGPHHRAGGGGHRGSAGSDTPGALLTGCAAGRERRSPMRWRCGWRGASRAPPVGRCARACSDLWRHGCDDAALDRRGHGRTRGGVAAVARWTAADQRGRTLGQFHRGDAVDGGAGLPARFACLEIGSSAGINLMLDRYAMIWAGCGSGRKNRGDALRARVARRAAARSGISPSPLPRAAMSRRSILLIRRRRLGSRPISGPNTRCGSSEWTPQSARQGSASPIWSKATAADFVEAELAKPQEPGTTRLLMHSIVWQYVPADQQARVTAAMEAAGARATADRPLAWVMVEADRTVHRHKLTVRYWPGRSGGGATGMVAPARCGCGVAGRLTRQKRLHRRIHRLWRFPRDEMPAIGNAHDGERVDDVFQPIKVAQAAVRDRRAPRSPASGWSIWATAAAYSLQGPQTAHPSGHVIGLARYQLSIPNAASRFCQSSQQRRPLFRLHRGSSGVSPFEP